MGAQSHHVFDGVDAKIEYLFQVMTVASFFITILVAVLIKDDSGASSGDDDSEMRSMG